MLRHLTLACLIALPALAQAAEPRTCLVVGVSDGDTITARCGAAGDYEQIKVRFKASTPLRSASHSDSGRRRRYRISST